MTAGDRLKAWRLVKGFKRRAVAKSLGFSPAMLSKLEENLSLPRVEKAIAIERLTQGEVPCEAWREDDLKMTDARSAKAARLVTDEDEDDSGASGEHGIVDPDAKQSAPGAA